MKNIMQIAVRNLFRYKRRTYLTTAIILFGVALVIVFSGFSNSFKKNMIGAITGGLVGDMQVHSAGYVASIENLPLYLSMNETNYQRLRKELDSNPGIEAYTPRIKFTGMVSSYVKTSGIRILAVDPVSEMKVCPNLTERVTPSPDKGKGLLKPGEIIMPASIAGGLNLKTGSEVVLLANNKEGSINAMTFKVAGTSGSITDPSGRDAYICIEDARKLLRLDQLEISEVAVKLGDFSKLKKVQKTLGRQLDAIRDPDAKPLFELHSWEQLSPIATFVRILDIFLIVAKLILVVIVLISVMNVMIMSVYERVGEIGTVAAIGTAPAKILQIFLSEGVSLGVFGACVGTAVGIVINSIVNLIKPSFTLAHMMKVILEPYISISDVIQACLIVITIAILASLEPAIRAARLEPVDAMRHN